MAKAKKLPSGSWRTQVFDYTDQSNKKHYKSFTAPTKKESEYLAAQYILNKEACERDKSNCTVHQILSEYIDSKRGSLSPTTISGYDCSLRNHFDDIKDEKISSLNSDKLQRWIGSLNKRLSPKTVMNAWGLFHSALDSAEIPFNYRVKLPQKESKNLYIPTDNDVKRLIQHFKDKDDRNMLLAVYLSAYGTLRRSEVCGLTADDVVGNTIIVNKALVDSHSSEGLVLKATKNTSSTRTIELPDFVIEVLPKTGKIVTISPSKVTGKFIRAVNELGLPHFRFHDLRHYSASIMHAIGVPDVYIMERGGWSSDRTLKAIYRNSLDDYQKKYTDITNDYFSKL